MSATLIVPRCRHHDEPGLDRPSSSARSPMKRRDFLSAGAMLSLGGCTARQTKVAAPIPALARYDAVPKLMPIRAHVDRLFRITVCLRPFRAAGPRLDVERVGDKTVIH